MLCFSEFEQGKTGVGGTNSLSLSLCFIAVRGDWSGRYSGKREEESKAISNRGLG